MDRQVRVLEPRQPTVSVTDNPWVLWQPIDQPTGFTCTQCGQEHTGLRYLELTGTEPQIFPVLPRNPAQLTTVTSRIGRRQVCPACRGQTPTPPPVPQPRKRRLD